MRPHQLAGSTYWNILRWAGSSQNVLDYSLVDGEVPLDSSQVPAYVVISAGSAHTRCSDSGPSHYGWKLGFSAHLDTGLEWRLMATLGTSHQMDLVPLNKPIVF
jgi:hypothetical protein